MGNRDITAANAIQNSSWVLARMSSAGSSALYSMLSYGRLSFDPKERVITVLNPQEDGGLVGVLKQLGSPAELERFFAWIAANRSARLKAQGKENLFTDQEIAAGVNFNQGLTTDGRVRPMLYDQVFKEIQQYRDDVLNIATQTGVISADARALWRDEFYVPFYRVMEDEVTGPRMAGGLSRQEAFKALKGGRQNLNDLFENTLMNFNHLLTASLRNQAATQALTNAEKVGAAHVVTEAERNPKTSTFILKDGRKVYYQVDDPDILEAVTSLSDIGLNNFAVRLMGRFKRFYSGTITVTPQYVVANVMRDLLQSAATTPSSANVVRNLVEGMREYRNVETRANMLASGAAFWHGFRFSDNVDDVKAALARKMSGAKLINSPSDVLGVLKRGWQTWGEITDSSENISRTAVFSQNLAQGRLKAAFEARDQMDFSQSGAWPARPLPSTNGPWPGLPGSTRRSTPCRAVPRPGAPARPTRPSWPRSRHGGPGSRSLPRPPARQSRA